MTCSEVHTKALELVQQAMNRQMSILSGCTGNRSRFTRPRTRIHTWAGRTASRDGLTTLLRNARSPFNSIPNSATRTTTSVFI